MSKKNQLLILSAFFCYYYCFTFFSIFFRWLFFPSKHIKIMFKECRRESVFTSYRIVLWNGTKTYTNDGNMALVQFKCVLAINKNRSSCLQMFNKKAPLKFLKNLFEATSAGDSPLITLLSSSAKLLEKRLGHNFFSASFFFCEFFNKCFYFVEHIRTTPSGKH